MQWITKDDHRFKTLVDVSAGRWSGRRISRCNEAVALWELRRRNNSNTEAGDAFVLPLTSYHFYSYSSLQDGAFKLLQLQQMLQHFVDQDANSLYPRPKESDISCNRNVAAIIEGFAQKMLRD